MSISTKTGDKGETTLLSGERVKKHDVRIEAYGTIDELNASIGVALSFIESNAIKEVLVQVQHDLFTIGAELSALTQKGSRETPKTNSAHIEFIEQALSTAENLLPAQKSFILPK